MWKWTRTRTTSTRDSWERLVAAVIKREQIRQLCRQDSITTVDSDFSERTLSLRSDPSPQLQLTRNSTKDDHFGLEVFSMSELRGATNHFNYENIIGHDKLSNKIYKGRLADGSYVVVKRLDAKISKVMMSKELEISSIVSHYNVIGLLGFCIAGKERLLVYPYMANGSVASFLRGIFSYGGFDESSFNDPGLDWLFIPGIALGTARGLAHLHYECNRRIIHCDLQPANIWLDKDFKPVVAGFSLAKLADCEEEDDGGTGTLICSMKTDVHNYGMFLLQLITEKQASYLAQLVNGDHITLLDWLSQIKNLWERKNFEWMIEQDLKGKFEEEVEKLLRIALRCTKRDPKRRPTMSEVVRILEDGDYLFTVPRH